MQRVGTPWFEEYGLGEYPFEVDFLARCTVVVPCRLSLEVSTSDGEIRRVRTARVLLVRKGGARYGLG